MNKDNKMQSVILTFDNGVTAIFTGKAVCFSGDTQRVTKVEFTVPRDLPDGYSWEGLSRDVEAT